MLSLSSVNCRYSKLTNPKLDLTLLSGLEIFSIDSVLFHAWTLWFYVTKYWWFHIFIQLDLEHFFVFPDTQTDIVKTRLMWLWPAMIPAQNFLWQENWLLVFFLENGPLGCAMFVLCNFHKYVFIHYHFEAIRMSENQYVKSQNYEVRTIWALVKGKSNWMRCNDGEIF